MLEEKAFQLQQYQERCAQCASSCAYSHYHQQEYFLMICSCQALKSMAVVLLQAATASNLSLSLLYYNCTTAFFFLFLSSQQYFGSLFLTLISDRQMVSLPFTPDLLNWLSFWLRSTKGLSALHVLYLLKPYKWHCTRGWLMSVPLQALPTWGSFWLSAWPALNVTQQMWLWMVSQKACS